MLLTFFMDIGFYIALSVFVCCVFQLGTLSLLKGIHKTLAAQSHLNELVRDRFEYLDAKILERRLAERVKNIS